MLCLASDALQYLLMEIVSAATPEHLAMVRRLFEEYWQSFGFTPLLSEFRG